MAQHQDGEIHRQTDAAGQGNTDCGVDRNSAFWLITIFNLTRGNR